MQQPLAMLAVWASCVLGAHAQHSMIPGFDFVKSSASHSGGLSFDDGSGDLEISRFDLRTAITKPITAAPGLIILPLAQYAGTLMNFADTAAGFPLDDMDLHSFSLSAFILQSCEGSPWFYGAWTRAELATDFRHITSDSVTYDFAAGFGYRFSERFTAGFGAALLNLNGDSSLYPGIALDWTPSDSVRIGLYGPNFIASWKPTPAWLLSLQGDTAGDIWTVQSEGRKRALDLSSYRVGLYADRLLGGEIWLRVGAGVTLANELELTTIGGSRRAGGDLDDGWFGEISLRLVQW